MIMRKNIIMLTAGLLFCLSMLLCACTQTGEPLETGIHTMKTQAPETEEDTLLSTEEATETPKEQPTEVETDVPAPQVLYIVQPDKKSSPYTVAFDVSADDAPQIEADRICKALQKKFDIRFRQTEASAQSRKKDTEIVLGSVNREECVALTATLSEGEIKKIGTKDEIMPLILNPNPVCEQIKV